MGIVRTFAEHVPKLGRGVFLADGAVVVGDVELGDESNLWYGTIVRGDVGKVRIGRRVNLQDLACVHMTTAISDAILADDVSVGHGAIIHGAVIEEGALIGMGCILMDNARVGAESIIGAGSLVTSGTVIPARSLALGRPARVIRPLSDGELSAGRNTANKYVGLAAQHRSSRIVES